MDRSAHPIARGGPLSVGALAAALALPVSASAASAFDVPLDAGGASATEVSATGGTLAWFTGADRGSEDPTAVHARRPDGTTTTAAVVGGGLSRLSAGTDAAGDLVLLAVRDRGTARRPNRDVVRIDPTSGALRKVPAAARGGVDETAAAVDRGQLVVARRTDGRSAVYSATLDGRRIARLVGTRDLEEGVSSQEVVDLAFARGGTNPRGGSLALTTFDARPEFGTQRAYGGRASGPRLAHRARSGGANAAGVRGLTWQGLTRLWFARTNQGSGTGNRIYRYSTQTRRTSEATGTANVRDTALVGGELGLVGAFGTERGGAGTLAATGRFSVRRAGR